MKRNFHRERYQRNSKWNFQGFKKEVEFPGVIKKKLCFQGTWFFALEFLRGVPKACGIFSGEALFCLGLEFPRVK